MYKLPYTGAEIESLLKGISNKNLLHNWDFRNPVNQRGQSSYSGIGYTIDRWKILRASVSLSIENGYIQLTDSAGTISNSTYAEEVENPSMLIGQTVTVSLNVKNAGGGCRLRVRFASSGNGVNGTFLAESYSAITTLDGIVSITTLVPVGTVGMAIIVRFADSVKLYSAKLELGSVSTLANDPPADYGEQLGLCQRYFQKIAQDLRFPRVQINVNYIDFFVPTPVSLRTTPTISGTFEVRTIAGVAQTGFTFAVVVHGELGALIRATKTSHKLTDAYINATGGAVLLSADL